MSMRLSRKPVQKQVHQLVGGITLLQRLALSSRNGIAASIRLIFHCFVPPPIAEPTSEGLRDSLFAEQVYARCRHRPARGGGCRTNHSEFWCINWSWDATIRISSGSPRFLGRQPSIGQDRGRLVPPLTAQRNVACVYPTATAQGGEASRSGERRAYHGTGLPPAVIAR